MLGWSGCGEAPRRGAGTNAMELRAGPRQENAGTRKRRWWTVGWLLVLVGVASAGVPVPSTRAERLSRDDVEAAYLYNFGKFVRWPAARAQGPLVLCVAAPDSFSEALSHLVAGEQINQRTLEVRAVSRPEGVGECSILFVRPTEPGRVDAYLTAVGNKPILTVGDAPDFLVRGGAVQFVQMEDHVRFSVNLDAANRSGLGLSSELLKVAVSVTGKPGTGGAR